MGVKGSDEGRIAGAASVIGSATALSRILGYIRDASVAYVFGAAMQTDAFFVAFRISNLLRRLVGEGALTSSFVPIFTEELTLRDSESARSLASSAFTLFAIILVVMAALGMFFSDAIVAIMSPGFKDDPEQFALTVNLTRLMFPYMVAIGLMAIAMGVLNSLRHFAAPALAPVLFNIAIITSIFAVTPILTEPVYALALGVVAGGCMQLLLQFPFLKRYGFMPKVSFRFSDPGIKKIFLLMGPAAFGVGVYQLNIFVTLWFASKLAEGSISYLYYASRLMELPLGVFGVAVSTAVLPSLSEHVAKGDQENFTRSLSFAVRIVNFVIIPAMAGLLVLNYPIIEILFRRGQFGAEAAAGTSYALFFYAFGLIPVAVSRVLVSVYYSLKDTVTPVYVAIVSFFSNVVLCYVLVGPLGHGGLALATTLSSTVNFLALFIILKVRFGHLGGGSILSSGVRALVASAVMGAVIYFINLKGSGFVDGMVSRAVLLGICLAVGVVSYLGLSMLLRSPEVPFLKGFFKKGG